MTVIGTVTINGGTVNGAINDMGNDTSVKGGTFDFDPSDYMPDGYKAVENEDGTYTVSTVLITGKQYTQTAYSNGTYYTRFVFVKSLSELEEKNKATFTTDYKGSKKSFESSVYYTSMRTGGAKYVPDLDTSVLLVVTVSSISDISKDLTCELVIE